MELLIGPLQQADCSQSCPLTLRQEGEVKRGNIHTLHNFNGSGDQGVFDGFSCRRVCSEQPRSGCRGKGNGALKLGIVAASRIFECIGPAMIEHVFTAAMVLEVEGHAA